MSFKKRVAFEPLREIAFGSLTSSFQAIGAATSHPIRWYRLVNNTDATIELSLTGNQTEEKMSPVSFLLIDLTANEVKANGFFVPKGVYFYAKYVGAAPTTGSLWISTMYAE